MQGARVESPQGGLLTGLLNPLMSIIVMPYLGVAAGRRELERPVAKSRAHRRKLSSDPLRRLEMRLTYRTVSALLAVGAHPRSSNKEIGDVSGATDQGQISKLLARLERLGLIQNDEPGSVRGSANAWVLTERGREVQGAFAE
jgi:DNA-binding MarR family transcriptional regulator